MPSKKSDIQFYADECFPIPVVTEFRSIGLSITHAYDLKIVRRSDLTHLRTSRKLKRVLITLDRDFLYYRQAKITDHQGIIVIAHTSTAPKSILEVCMRMLKHITKSYVKGSIVTVTRSKITKEKKGKIISEKNI